MGAKKSKQEREIEKKTDGVNIENIEERNSIVILGASNSGKSTVYKALKWHSPNNIRWNDEDMTIFVDIIRHYCVTQMVQLLEVMKETVITQKLEISEDVEQKIMVLEDACYNQQFIDSNLQNLMEHLIYFWNDAMLKDILIGCRKNHESFIGDNIEYFMDKLNVIFDTQYKPTKQDILRVRTRTTGFTDFERSINGKKYRFCDIGGRRSERSKWLLFCLKESKFAIFVCGLNQYAQRIWDDDKNAMQESLDLFEKIINAENKNNEDKKTKIILLLNKTDLFREYIKETSIKTFFEDYNGRQYNDFMKSDVFENILKSEERNLDIFIPQNVQIMIGQFCAFLTCDYWMELCYKNGVEFIKQKHLQYCNSNSSIQVIVDETCALNIDQVNSVIHDAIFKIEMTEETLKQN